MKDIQADAILKELTNRLEPFGWRVSLVTDPINRRVMYYFDYVFNNDSELRGVRLSQVFVVNSYEVMYDPHYLVLLPDRWARDVMMNALRKVTDAYDKLKAGEIDWRPDEMIPEDYYAM